MLAPPTKDIFLGLRQQVCSLLPQLQGWFLHTCNLTACWIKEHKAPSITLLESQRCCDQPSSWTFLPESSPSHRFLLPETDKALIIVQYLTKWLSICENIRTHHKVWQKLRIGSTFPRRLPQLRSQHYAHNSVLQTQLILRDEKLVYICETYQGQRIYLHMEKLFAYALAMPSADYWNVWPSCPTIWPFNLLWMLAQVFCRSC